MRHLAVVCMVVLVAAILVGGQPALQAGKASKPAPVRWACQLTLRDADGDAIQSDGRGAYRDGMNGVLCGINLEPNTGTYQWLNIDLSARTSTRSFYYPGQTDASGYNYFSFSTKGTFQVKQFATVVAGSTDTRPFRAFVYDKQFSGGTGRFTGDNASNPGTSSVIVDVASDGCNWTVWFDPTTTPGLMELAETTKGSGPYGAPGGYYPMPFSATVTVIGGKAGC